MSNSAFSQDSAAVTDATYLTTSDETSAFSNSVSLGDLTTGLILNTVAAGVSTLTTAVEGTTYYGPGGTDIAIADGGTNASTAADARTNLGLAIGTDVQAYDATLASISSLGTAADKMLYTTGIDTWAEADISAFGRSLIDDAAASNARTTLGLVIGTDVQAYDAGLASIAGLTTAADKMIYTTALDTYATTDLTAQARALLDDTTQLAQAQTILNNVGVTAATVASADAILGLDADDSGNLKSFTAQSIADLATPAGGTAPANATYIVQTADGTLTNEQALGALATGIVKNTTTTGVLSIAAEGTDYYGPGGTDIALADGGTNASLVASNGGIFYSTATAGAILAGTATANQMLQSGLSSAPAWSTATWPATTTANQLLYSSAANTVAGLTSANSSILVTSGAGVPSLSTAIPDGVTATTQSASDNSTKIATTAYVDTAVGGGSTLLSSQTASASASLDFDNLTTTASKNYLLRLIDIAPDTDNAILYIRVGTGATPTYQTSNYRCTSLVFTTSATGQAATSQGQINIGTTTTGVGNAAGEMASLDAIIYYPESSSTNTMIKYEGGHKTNAGALLAYSGVGVWEDNTSVTSVQVLFSTGNIASGTVELWEL